MNKEKVIGIDLGTGNSAVGIINELGDVIIAPNEAGGYTTPSIVLFDGGERLVGEPAKRKMIMKPTETISHIKRFMGADWGDKDVQKMISEVSYKVYNKNNKPVVKIGDRDYTPEEISSYILTTMKKVAENYYGTEVKKAVITVPAFFNDNQRQATKLAGELAGLEVMRVINEPTAAILASDIDAKEDCVVAVTDLGAGTADISVVEISNVDGETMYEVLASYGDVFLGGQNYDNVLVDYICDEFQKQEGVDLRKDVMAYSRIVQAAEKAKIELSGMTSVDINEPYITSVDGVPKMLTMTITRAKFEQLTENLTNKFVDLTKTAIEKSGRATEDIDCFLLVGGSTRIPAVQEALTKNFNRPLNKSVNPDQAVALGATIQANILAGNDTSKNILLLDVTPLSLGIETEGGIMTTMIEASTTIPTEKTETFTTAADGQTSVGIMVYQGERKMCADNKLVGQFFLDGILPAPRGTAKIDVTFSIDANGILNVSAKDQATGKEQHITIQNQSLSDEEINRIKREAEEYAEADNKRKKEAEEINQAEALAYGLKTSLNEDKVKDLVTESEQTELNGAINELLEGASKKDHTLVMEKKKKLEELFAPIATKLYSQQQQTPPETSKATDQAPGNNPDEPEDVQFEEVN